MKMAFGPKRSKSFRDKYLALALIAAAFFLGGTAKAQFPSTDSLHKYNNRYVNNSPVDAFANKRLNTLIHGIIQWIDSARAGEGGSLGIDQIQVLSDSSFRYRLNGAYSSPLVIKGTYDNRTKVEAVIGYNDTTLAVVRNGPDGVDTTFISKGTGSSSGDGVSQDYVDSLFSTIPPGAVYIDGVTIIGGSDFANPMSVDTSYIVTHTQLGTAKDSIGRTAGIDSIQVYRNGTHIYSVKDSIGGAGTGDNWGTQGVLADGFHSGTGKVGDTLRLDTAELYDEVLTRIPNAPFPDFFAGSGISISGNDETGYTFTNTGSPGSNPRQAYSILDFGGAGDAVIPGTGSVPTSGTNNTPALNTMFSTLPDGSVIYLPGAGRKYWFKTVPDTLKNNKKFYFIADGDIYNINTSGQGIDFLIIKNESGAYEQNRFEFRGNCYGKINQASHTKTTHDNGTGPNWPTYTGTLVKIVNTHQQWVEINKAEGYQQPVNIMATQASAAAAITGSQENTVIIRWSYKNANAMTLQSTTGFGYVDKNDIWIKRASGGLGLKIDGYATPVDVDAGAGVTLEPYNASFSANEFHMMIEQVDSVLEAHGDIREPVFDLIVEGGVNTSVFSGIGFRVRSVSPNYVRDPIYSGWFYGISWMQNGLGINARGNVPIWNSSAGRRYGNEWKTDGNGNLIVIGSTLTANQRALEWSGVSYAQGDEPQIFKSITASSYTIAVGETIRYSNASGTITAPSASANVGKRFTVQNIHGSAAVTISGVATYTSVPAGDNMTWESNGTDWRGVVNAEGTSVGGTSIFTADANGYTTGDKVGFRTASVSGAAAAFPASTTSVAPIRIATGSHPTTPANGDFWHVLGRLYFAYNSIVKELLTVPNNGVAKQVPMRNAANDDHEYKYVDRTQYSNTSTIIATGANSSSKTSITGGTVTVDPLNTGDVIVISGAGIIQTASSGTIQPTFDYLLNSTASIFNTATLATSSVYYYQYTIRVVAGGNSSVELRISLNGNTAPLVYYNSGSSSGLNLSAPTVNVRAWFTTSGNQVNADVSTVKVERK